MAQSARAVVKMIARDVRMGGYNDFNATDISEAVKITDSAGNCCDRIDIIYDKSKTERQKISYYTKQYKNRNRLMKTVLRCTTPDCSNTSTLQSEQPIADYVEDLQFNGMKNGKTASTGAVEYGQGNMKFIYPATASSKCEDVVNNVNGGQGSLTDSGSATFAIDNNLKTTYSCSNSNPNSHWPNFGKSGELILKFGKYFRPTKIHIYWVPDLDGGTSYHGQSISNYRNPYGKYRPFYGDFAFYINPHDRPVSGNRCVSEPGNFCTTYQRFYGGGMLNQKGYWEYTCDTSIKSKSGVSGGSSNFSGRLCHQVINGMTIKMGNQKVCNYTGNPVRCSSMIPHIYQEIAEINFFGEVYGESVIPTEVEIGLLLRSPKEHISKNTSFSINLGNRAFTSNDKYLRDNYSTSVIVRNLYYASQ